MRTRRLGSTLLAAFALLVAGCGGTAAAGTDAVAWTDDVCGALSGFTVAATKQPSVDRTNAAAAVTGVRDYLAATSDGVQQSIDALGAVGPSPVDGGDEYVRRLEDALVRIRTSFEAARSQLTNLDTSRPDVLATALPAATAPLQELRTMPSPTEGLRANDALRAASEKAPNCEQLRSVSSPAG